MPAQWPLRGDAAEARLRRRALPSPGTNQFASPSCRRKYNSLTLLLFEPQVQSEGSWTTLKSHVVTVVRVKEPKAKQDYPPDDDDDDGCELQTWISDVGYASCPHTPLRYDWIGVEQPGDGEWAGFRLTRVKAEVAEDDPDQECVMMERRRKADGEWLKAILIYEQPHSLAELTPNCDVPTDRS